MDILCAAVAEGRLTLTELGERVGAALSARAICERAAPVAGLPGRRTLVPASAPAGVSPPASPGWASRAPERRSLLQSLARRPEGLPGRSWAGRQGKGPQCSCAVSQANASRCMAWSNLWGPS